MGGRSPDFSRAVHVRSCSRFRCVDQSIYFLLPEALRASDPKKPTGVVCFLVTEHIAFGGLCL